MTAAPRGIGEIADNPIPGDAIELREKSDEDTEVMLRVMAVVEDHVGFKEYGRGRFWLHRKSWKARIDNAAVRNVIWSPTP